MSGSSLKAVIFDVDGTLAETEETHRLAFNAAFEVFGFEFSWDQALYKDLLKVAGGKERVRHYLGLFHPDELKRPDIDAIIPALHKRKTAFYEEMLNAGRVELRPGVARLIEELRSQGIALGVATTTHQANLKALLRNTLGATGESLFDVMGCGEHAPLKKPAPDVYLHVLKELGQPPRNCIAIEDAEIGLRAARAALLPTVITVSPYTAGGHFSGAVAILSDLGEPTEPFTVLEGNAHGRTYVTPDLLRQWNGEA
ncbi:MAG: hypothetical protein A2516_06245 [Alphaproteobacteria bacterium RIFOXYD12_FULL_60_8]|nr:MAG: hypothetical protein A2516_06245 [Alphaproteobacteria bacterium RIFOXYD12_FULL_60_8]